MRITAQQQGPIAQNEFAKLVMLGSDGEVELNLALTDDEGRDVELHRRRGFGVVLSIQIKSVLKLRRDHAILKLRTQIQVPRSQFGAHHRYLFFFAQLAPRTMAFAKPCFLVPSAALYRRAPRGHRGKLMTLEFDASMAPTSHDQWAGYRVAPDELGVRLLQMLRQLERRSIASARGPPD